MSTTTATLHAHLEAVEKQIAELQEQAAAIRKCLGFLEAPQESARFCEPEPAKEAKKAKEAKGEKKSRRYLTTAEPEMWRMFATELMKDGKAHHVREIIKAARGAGRVSRVAVSHWLMREKQAGRVVSAGVGLHQKAPMQLARVAAS